MNINAELLMELKSFTNKKVVVVVVARGWVKEEASVVIVRVRSYSSMKSDHELCMRHTNSSNSSNSSRLG